MLLKIKHLPRYKEIARLLWRHGWSSAFRQLAEFGEDLEGLSSDGKEPNPEELVDDLEKMGPTFVKMGRSFPAGRTCFRKRRVPQSYPSCNSGIVEKCQENSPFKHSSA